MQNTATAVAEATVNSCTGSPTNIVIEPVYSVTGNTDASAGGPTTATEVSSAFVQFVLQQIRIAKLRAELTANQAEMAITALSDGLISPEAAILILAECGIEVSS